MDGEEEERVSTGSYGIGDVVKSPVDPELVKKYEHYVKKAKQEAKSGNLSKSIEYFQKADHIYPSEKLKGRIQKLEDALNQLDLQEEQDDEFVDVLKSGLTVYKDLHDKLFEHQKEGVAFLYSLYRDGRKGGILADDMGLGKTIQVIAFLSGMFDAELIRCVLLVMPTTLISNWIKEFAKWTPGMRVAEFHGTSKKERSRNLEKIQRKSGIAITTYQMLINNWQQLSSYNDREFVWDYIILDEAHKIKSSSTKTAKSCQSIPAKNRILLTGTPIQNNLREMWALYDFACQGTLLGTYKTFKMEYENPITRAREKDSQPVDKALGLKISENLMKIIQPYFLRRTKSDVQNKKASGQHPRVQDGMQGPAMPSLTRKNDLILWVYLSSIQEEVYRKFISLDQIKELLMTTRSPLAELTILKKLCDHPRLLSATACIELGLDGDDHCNEECERNVVTKFDHLSDEILIEESGKLMLLIDLLQKLNEEGHRTLVFSQSRKMLDMIDRILYNRNFKVMRIDGTVPLPEREKRINTFQNNRSYSVLLLTTQVGGVGLTLTAADRVVIFDPSWNPATDAQAVDRAYRIGQQENVVIYRLITCGTVEEKIYRRQIFKDSLIRQTTGDKKNPFRYFTKQELKELFLLEDTRTSSTQIQLQNMLATHRKTDTHLDNHIAFLHTLQIFGISDHDLIYSNEVPSQEDSDYENEHGDQYIEQRVQKAHELVQMESQLNGQLMEQIRKSSEGAWVKHITAATDKPKQRSLPSVPKYNSEPITVDLTEDDVGEVSFQMTSLVIDNSTAEEDADLPQAPFIHKPLNTNSNISNAEQDCEQIENISVPGMNAPEVKPQFSDLYCSKPQNNHSLKEYEANHSAEKKPAWSVEQQTATKIEKHYFYNISRELQKSCVMDDDIQELESSLSRTKSQLPCDFNLVLDDSMERAECNESVEGLECAMEVSAVADKKAVLVLDDSTNGTNQMDALEMSVSSDKGEIMVLEDSVLNVNASAISHTSEKEKNCQNKDERILKSFNDSKVQRNSNNPLQSIVDVDSEEDAEEIFFSTKKKTTKRIESDSETENSVFENEKMFSPFNSPSVKGITASTPKLDKSISDTLFPHRRSLGRRRSIASRRSLVHVAVEAAEDVNDTIDVSSSEESEGDELITSEAREGVEEESMQSEEEPVGETLPPDESISSVHVAVEAAEDVNDTNDVSSSEESEGDKLFTSEAKEGVEEESMQSEEEPIGETLPPDESISQCSEDYESDSFIVKSSFDKEDHSSVDESTGELELLSGEHVDCLAQKNAELCVVSANEDPYTALVNRGKHFKDTGKLKEALDCFLKALDLKPGDPEIMMITLNLYRQQPHV
ncbi:hypothetical protein GDO86_015256 [Hymenochirus boettgeri]|uniref:DNA excision repair protein ERCC-6-like n=1 Tax=Hymenochirus boettgeri TaxID=247094 RepID=A0A8T2JUR8_9PIPI|nr:hypothetical protein GDO86_015256 [Hymenochirus boettgeri]